MYIHMLIEKVLASGGVMRKLVFGVLWYVVKESGKQLGFGGYVVKEGALTQEVNLCDVFLPC